jgi:hypothetical protein
MDLIFVSTGQAFPYPYYLAVLSALKTQKVDKVNIFATELPECELFYKVEHMPNVSIVSVGAPDFPALHDKAEHFRMAHVKDYIAWRELYRQGGILMDLDTFSLKDITYLLNSGDVVTTPYRYFPYNAMGISFNQFNNAVVVAKPHSIIIGEALAEAEHVLMADDVAWGQSGPIAFGNAIQRHFDLVDFAPYGAFGDVLTSLAQIPELYKEDGVPDPNTHVLHLYASANKEGFANITVESISEGKTLFARLVQQILNKDEWYVP